MPVGLFEKLDDIEFDHQVFIDDKPKYYDFANKTKNITGKEVLLNSLLHPNNKISIALL